MSLLIFPSQPERRTQRYSVEYDGKVIRIEFLGLVQPAPDLEQTSAARLAMAA